VKSVVRLKKRGMPPKGLTMGKSAKNVVRAADGRSCKTRWRAIPAFTDIRASVDTEQ
jgi:hypothetical protein